MSVQGDWRTEVSEKQILVLPKNHGLTNADRKALREAGVIVVTVRTPHEARLLSAERLPTDSNEMLRQLVKTVASLGGLNAEAFKAHCFMAIAKAVGGPQR